MVGRFRLPHYGGKDVTSEEGYRWFLLEEEIDLILRCMAATSEQLWQARL
jgi:hypothetical protein